MNLEFIKPQNLGSLLMKSSQSNFDLRSPSSQLSNYYCAFAYDSLQSKIIKKVYTAMISHIFAQPYTFQMTFNKQRFRNNISTASNSFKLQLMIFLNFNRLSYDKTIENSENEPATLVLYLELKNRNRERHEEYLVKIIFKLKYKKIF